MATAASWISRKPGRSGGEACIRDTRIPVWSLIEQRRLGRSDAELLRAYPDLTTSDLDVAWEYAAAHAEEIELALWLNEVCMFEHDGRSVPAALIQHGRQLGLSTEEIRNAFDPPLSAETLANVPAERAEP